MQTPRRVSKATDEDVLGLQQWRPAGSHSTAALTGDRQAKGRGRDNSKKRGTERGQCAALNEESVILGLIWRSRPTRRAFVQFNSKQRTAELSGVVCG